MAKVVKSSSDQEQDLINVITSKASLSGDLSKRIISGLRWLGLFSDVKVHRRGNLLDTLCATLEQKMQYEEGERDMVMLQHKFDIELKDGSKVILLIRKFVHLLDCGLEKLEETLLWLLLLEYLVPLPSNLFWMVRLLSVVFWLQCRWIFANQLLTNWRLWESRWLMPLNKLIHDFFL